ncbi:MAG: GAF domain-containing protein [Acidobacteriota bacterium]
MSSIRLYGNLERLSQASHTLARTEGPAETLDAVVSAIQTATEADFVILYPFYKDDRVFRSPRVGGPLKAPERHGRVDGMPLGELPQLLLQSPEPVYCRTAAQIWEQLGASPPAGAGGFQKREGIASVAALSIKAGDEAAGVVFINYRKQQPFDAPQKRLIESLGIHAAAALNNARELLRHGQRRDKELQVLQAIDKEINSTGDHQRALELVLRGISEVVGAEEAAILLAEDFHNQGDGDQVQGRVREAADLFVAAALGDHREESLTWRIPAAEAGLAGLAFRERQSVMVDDVHGHDRYLEMRRDTVSELDVPILHEGVAVGVINLESPRKEAFSQEDRDFVEVLANQVLLAVRRARDVEIAQQRAKERGILMALGREIIGEIKLEKLLPLVLRKARETTGATAAILLLYDQEADQLVVSAEEGAERGLGINTRIGLDQGVVGLVASDRSMRNINPTHAKWRGTYLAHGEQTMRSQLAYPMLEGKRCWGVLNLESPKPFKFSQREVRLVEALANMAVIALRNAEAYGQAKRSSERLEALRNVTQEILEQDDPEAITRYIAADAIKLTGSVSADLAIYSPEGDLELVLVWFLQEGGDHHEEFLQDIDQFRDLGYLDGIMARVAATGESYRTRGDAQEDSFYKGAPNVHSELAVPLKMDGSVIGVLNVESHEANAFDASDEELLELFADEVVIAFENARNLEEAQRRLEKLRLMIETSEDLAKLDGSGDGFRSACRIVAAAAAEHCDCPVAVRATDKNTSNLVLLAQEKNGTDWRFSGTVRPRSGEDQGRPAKDREVRYIPDVFESTLSQEDPRTRSLVVAPVLFKNEHLGEIVICHPEPEHFDEDDLKFFRGLAQILGITRHRVEAWQREEALIEEQKQNELIGWIGDASYGIAHRLSNDLVPVRARLELIQEHLEDKNVFDATCAEYMSRASDQLNLVLDLAERLVEESKQLGKKEKTDISVEHLILELKDQFRELPEDVELDSQIPEGIAPIRAVTNHPLDILHNLVKNAIEAFGASPGRISIRAEESGSEIALEVQDNGPGISPELREDIFDFLVKGKESNGSGFGLWSSRRKAEASGGSLTVTSEVGQGSTFTLKLPKVAPSLETQF